MAVRRAERASERRARDCRPPARAVRALSSAPRRYHLYGIESWDFLPSGDIVIQANDDSKDNNYDYTAKKVDAGAGARIGHDGDSRSGAASSVVGGDAFAAAAATTTASSTAESGNGGGDDDGAMLHWKANAQLQQVSPLGALRGQYISACAGHPLNYNQVPASRSRARYDRRPI